jgi:CDP-paratose 2-epimerase
LDAFCKTHINKQKLINRIEENRRFDIPLYVTDYTMAEKDWGWKPTIDAIDILHQIVSYAKEKKKLIEKL